MVPGLGGVSDGHYMGDVYLAESCSRDIGESNRNRLKIDKLFRRLQLFSCLFSGTINKCNKKQCLFHLFS